MMTSTTSAVGSIALFVFLIAPGLAQQGNEAITPNTIRIQSIDSPKEGSWVTMDGFSELGSPCLSRDGDWIAFDGYKEGFNNSTAESWIARRDGTDLKRLAMGATPRWSFDGSRLLFVRERVNNPKWDDAIFQIDRDGTHERRIGEGRWPDWSPDGKEIVFSIGGTQTGGARRGATIRIASSDGSNRRELTSGDCPSWSPDGTKIAFCLTTPGHAPLIRVYDLQTKKEDNLRIGWFRANWMPDSKGVVAYGFIDQKRCMARFWLDTPWLPSELTTEYDHPQSPCCSWDGKQIIYIANRPQREAR
jgi:Tol biopolymer transport system component